MNNSYRVERYKKMKHQDIRDKIHLTYLSLVASEDASTINVRKLAEAAGIARSTFYIYLDNIEQLVIDIENEFLYQFEKLYKQHIRCPFTAPEHFEAIEQIICFLKENYHTFLILCGSQGSNSFVMKLVNTLKLLLVKKLNYLHVEYSEVQLTFAATGFMSVIDFLDTDKTTKEIAQEYCDLFIHLFH